MKVVEFESLEEAEAFADRCDAEIEMPPVKFIGGGRHCEKLPRVARIKAHPTERRWIAVVPEAHAEKLGAVELRPDFFPESPSAKAGRMTKEEASTERDPFVKALALSKETPK